MRSERWARVVEALDQIPIEEEVKKYTKLIGYGSSKMGLCPIHAGDKHLGSFKIHTGKNWWRCFACGSGGVGIISFYRATHNNCSFEDAVIALCKAYGIPSPKESGEFVAPARGTAQTFQRAAAYSNKKLPPDQLDLVYRAFVDCANPMNREQAEDLIRSRNLEPEDLDHFFTFPKDDDSFMEALRKRLTAAGAEHPDELLKHTPGFFYDEKRKRIGFMNRAAGALGIIARDNKGRINGIQIRRNSNDHKKRYFWFSSGFADGTNGLTSGTVNDKIIDCMRGRRFVACTEGKFKGIALNHLGYSVLNMHGVSAWPTEKVLKLLDRNKIQKVDLFYDADFMTNVSVAKAALKFSEALIEHGLTVRYGCWDPAYGKGIDDVLNAGNRRFVRMEPAETVNETLRSFVS